MRASAQQRREPSSRFNKTAGRGRYGGLAVADSGGSHAKVGPRSGRTESRTSQVGALQTTDLNEDRSAVDRLTGGVELVAIEPRPTVVGGPVMNTNDAEQQWRRELNARFSSHTDNVAGPGYQPDSLAVGKV